MAGPPREMYREDLEAERWQDLVARSVWLHLAKLNTSGLVLGAPAATRLAELCTTYPQWQLGTNERDEFSHWMSGTGDPDYENSRDVDIAPRKRSELVQWLAKPTQERRPFYEDTWRDTCKKHPLNCLYALTDLANQRSWLNNRWSEALYAWMSGKQVLRMWRYSAPILKNLPNEVLQKIVHSVSSWIEASSKSVDCHEDILIELCNRVLGIQVADTTRVNRNGEDIQQPVTEAINHPVGHIAQALINFWFRSHPNDNDLLPIALKPIFTALCDLQVERFRHARVLLGSRLIAFYRVDRSWTVEHLLPLFDWTNPEEAKAVWEGFLWSPRLYQPLMIEFKNRFLECANQYINLGEHRQQFASFLTYAALAKIDGYTIEEFRTAFGALPKEGLEESAQALYQAIEGAADQREEYWKNRTKPFWQQIWPKCGEIASPRISESLARLVIAARNAFPDALTAMESWLQPIEHPHYFVRLLNESGLCSRYPDEALSLLDAVITDQQWLPSELSNCLDMIVQTKQNLKHDVRYLRLRDYLRMRGA